MGVGGLGVDDGEGGRDRCFPDDIISGWSLTFYESNELPYCGALSKPYSTVSCTSIPNGDARNRWGCRDS